MNVILQYFGLGDIIFCQTLAHEFEGEKFWPVKKEWIEGLSYAYPEINWVDYEGYWFDTNAAIYSVINFKRGEHFNDGMRFLPFSYAEWIMGRPYKMHMVSKYDLFRKDWRRWKERAYPVRNRVKEDKLKAILGIDGPYNFINTKFGSNGQYEIPLEIKNGYKNIELKFIEGFSLFDWCGVIEGASEIHSVSTSTLYLYELLTLKGDVHLYVRRPIEKDFEYVKFLFTKPYILH